jgi:hypothetical protein
MVVDEQEFRKFIANIDKLLQSNYQNYFNSPNLIEYAQTIYDVEKYKKLLEGPKPSKWKQLKLEV